MSKVVLRLLAISLLAEWLQSAPLTLAISTTINQLSSGVPFFTFNLVAMNGNFYSIYGYGFNKAAYTDSFFTLMNLNGFTTNVPVGGVTTLVPIPEVSRLLYINSAGGVFVLDPNNPSSPLVGNTTLLYFGDNYQNVAVYQIERKPNTNFFYVTNLIGKALQKIDYTNLQSVVRIISGPTNDLGYEMITISANNYLLTISSNGVNLDLYDLNTDAYLKSLSVEAATSGAVYRCARSYPRNVNTAFYFVTRTDSKAYLINSALSTVEKVFTIAPTLPESVKHMPNTNWMIIIGSAVIEFYNMEGSDSDTLTHTVSGSPNIYWGTMEFVQISSNWYLAASFVYMTGTSPTSTYLFTLPNQFCHFSCATCSKPMDPASCSTCISSYIQAGSNCNPPAPPTCAAGQYKDNNGLCKACPVNCNACTDGFGYCTTCAGSNKIDPNGKCIASCTATGQVLQTVSSKDYCLKCHMTCNTCSGTLPTQCATCRTGGSDLFTQSGNTCVDKCINTVGAATTYIQANTSCASCTGVGSCKVCSYPGLSFSCVQCNPGLYWYNGVCVSSCPLGLVPNTGTFKCESCEEKALNKIFYNGSCISDNACPAGLTLSKMRCVNSSAPVTAPTSPFSNGASGTITTSAGSSTSNGNTQGTTSSTSSSTTATADSGGSSGPGFSLFAIIGLALVVVVVAGILIYYKCIRKRKPIMPAAGVPGQAAPGQAQQPYYGEQGEVEDYGPEDDQYNRGNSVRQPQFAVHQASRPPPMEFVDFKKQRSIIKPGQLGPSPGGPQPGPFPQPNTFQRPNAFPQPSPFDEWDAPVPLPYQPSFNTNRPANLMDSHVSEMQQMASGRMGMNQPQPFYNPLPQEAQLVNRNMNGPTRRIAMQNRNR